eukprot:11701340-Alexandrium_andersonii.AAC.1
MCIRDRRGSRRRARRRGCPARQPRPSPAGRSPMPGPLPQPGSGLTWWHTRTCSASAQRGPAAAPRSPPGWAAP